MKKQKLSPGDEGIEELQRIGYYTFQACEPIREYVYMKTRRANPAHVKALRKFDRLLNRMRNEKFWADEVRQPA